MSPRKNQAPDPGSRRTEWPDVLTAAEVAEYLRINYMTVLRMTHGGHLPALAVGREFRYLRTEIDKMMRTPAAIDPAHALDVFSDGIEPGAVRPATAATPGS